jgi:hypothetical protein
VSEYLDELRDVIRRLHGVESSHIETVSVKEVFGGQTVWDGNVEVFKLHGHPKANRVYAWAHETDDPLHPKRHVTILHIPPITSAVMAVKAAIVEEFRNREPEEA